ncbi:MAG TPA: oxidoreductase, partial [Allosphingosinicella sp.]|nr:oxidoreductase [Allosphingosinicella sp.]
KYGVDPQEARIKTGRGADAPGLGDDVASAYGTFTSGDGAIERIATQPGCWRRFYEAVADAVLEGAPPPVDPADARAGLRILETARRSAAEGRTLPL